MIGLWGPQSLMSNNISPIDAEFANIFFKPIAHYLSNPETAEVMVNAHDDIWVEDNNGLWKAPESFTQDALVSAVNSLAQYVGRPLMENVFAVDARMPDGSRVCIVLPPVSGKDPIFAIRKFKEVVNDLEFLVKKNSLTSEMVELIDACVKIKKNIMVSGGTSSGKTTLLNLIAAKIPDYERILTIEDSRELQLKQEHVLSLEAKPQDKHGKGEFTIRQCLKSTLRLRPDRIIVGEIRGGEAFDLIQAMNTGHGGCMGTVHANTPTDTLRRIESLALTADVDMPLVALRSMIASALDMVITPARLSDGSRRIVQIAEIGPLTEKGDYQTFDIVRFVSTKRDKNTGKIEGYFEFTGYVPTFFDMFEAEGVDVPLEFFRRRAIGNIPASEIPKLLARGFEVPGQPKTEPHFLNLPFSQVTEETAFAKPSSAQVVHQETVVQEKPIVTEEPVKPPVSAAAILQTLSQKSEAQVVHPGSESTHTVSQEQQAVPQTAFIDEAQSFVPEPSFVHEVPAQPFNEVVEEQVVVENTHAKSNFEEFIEEPIHSNVVNALPQEPHHMKEEVVETINFNQPEEENFTPATDEYNLSQPLAVEPFVEEAAEFFPQAAPTNAVPDNIFASHPVEQPSEAPVAGGRPSLLERLSKLSGSYADSAPLTHMQELPQEVQSLTDTVPVEDEYQIPNNYTFEDEATPEKAVIPDSFEELDTTYQSAEVSEALPQEQHHQASPQDEYGGPAAYSFEDEIPSQPVTTPQPQSDFHYAEEKPEAVNSNLANELPQTASEEHDSQEPESKQHAVIAEILKRMRENRNS
jgi:Flp pilus assembly CpaF family ATPase